MRKILGDLGTMCLGVTAILIAAVIISIGAGGGLQLVSVVGSVLMGLAGIGLRIVGDGGGSDDAATDGG